MNTNMHSGTRSWAARFLMVLLLGVSVAACTPRVEVAAPKEPITINLNVKIEHEIRVKVDKDLEEEIFSDDSGLF